MTNKNKIILGAQCLYLQQKYGDPVGARTLDLQQTIITTGG